MRRFARVELGDDKVPDESTILQFRHLLERKGLTERIFAEVNDLLAGMKLHIGTDRRGLVHRLTAQPYLTTSVPQRENGPWKLRLAILVGR